MGLGTLRRGSLLVSKVDAVAVGVPEVSVEGLAHGLRWGVREAVSRPSRRLLVAPRSLTSMTLRNSRAPVAADAKRGVMAK